MLAYYDSSALLLICVRHEDNEYSQSGYGRPEYFQELEDAYRGYGIVVPFTYNDPGEGRSFINGTVGFPVSNPYLEI